MAEKSEGSISASVSMWAIGAMRTMQFCSSGWGVTKARARYEIRIVPVTVVQSGIR